MQVVKISFQAIMKFNCKMENAKEKKELEGIILVKSKQKSVSQDSNFVDFKNMSPASSTSSNRCLCNKTHINKLKQNDSLAKITTIKGLCFD